MVGRVGELQFSCAQIDSRKARERDLGTFDENRQWEC